LSPELFTKNLILIDFKIDPSFFDQTQEFIVLEIGKIVKFNPQ